MDSERTEFVMLNNHMWRSTEDATPEKALNIDEVKVLKDRILNNKTTVFFQINSEKHN